MREVMVVMKLENGWLAACCSMISRASLLPSQIMHDANFTPHRRPMRYRDQSSMITCVGSAKD
jgi:hypothetical protein